VTILATGLFMLVGGIELIALGFEVPHSPADKGHHYQFVFARNSKHTDRPTVAQTFPAALEWL